MDILKREIGEPKKNLVGEWLKESELVLLYASRGIGKTYMSLYLAFKFASGGKFLGYSCTRSKIIYFDGEMGNTALRERVGEIDLSPENESGLVEGFFYTHSFEDNLNKRAWNLSTEAGQAKYDEKIEESGADIIFLDNLNTLSAKQDSRDSDFDMWIRTQDWLIKKRLEGKTVIIIHHAGKSGLQLGTSQRENIMDLMIGLKKTGIEPKEHYTGLEFIVEKTRGIHTDKIKNLYAEFTVKSKAFSINYQNLYEKKASEIQRLSLLGLKKMEIASKLGMDSHAVSEILIKQERENMKWNT